MDRVPCPPSVSQHVFGLRTSRKKRGRESGGTLAEGEGRGEIGRRTCARDMGNQEDERESADGLR